MTTIAVYGCSWTQGLKAPYDNNWVYQLSLRYPHIDFLDFSKGGSSIQFSSYLRRKVTETTWKPDYEIFQLTVPYRLTLWHDEDFKVQNYVYERTPNYTAMDNNKLTDDLVFASSSWAAGTKNKSMIPPIGWEHYEFILDYYTHQDTWVHEVNYSSVAQRMINECDFVYYHKNQHNSVSPCNGYLMPDAPSVEDDFGSKWDQYLIDNAGHFSLEGAVAVADWMEDKFLRPNDII